jgi:hypothetical protein
MKGAKNVQHVAKAKKNHLKIKRWSVVFDTIEKRREYQKELVLMGMLGRYSRLEELGYRA